MRVGESAPAEIRHRIRFAPDHVVENPKFEILHDRADAENIVIRADDPDGRRRLHHATAAASQRLVKSSYAEKLPNLSQASSTASTCESSGRFRSFASCRL